MSWCILSHITTYMTCLAQALPYKGYLDNLQALLILFSVHVPHGRFLSPQHSLSVAAGHTGSWLWSRDMSSSSFGIQKRTEQRKTAMTIKKIKVRAVDATSRNELVKWTEASLSPAWLGFTNNSRSSCWVRCTYQWMHKSHHHRGSQLDFTNSPHKQSST